MDIPADALGFVLVVGTLLGTAFGIKILIWGKGPLRQLRRGGTDTGLEDRVAELEDRVRQMSNALVDQSHRLDDCDERLEFTERVLTRESLDARKELRPPGE